MASPQPICSPPARSWPVTSWAKAIWRDSAWRSARHSDGSRAGRPPEMHSAEAAKLPEIRDEARRAMEICNACRYCEGFCAVFPAMEQRRVFADADLDYLANLCHGCRGCYYACQYAPPHEFGINLPRTFAELRSETYAEYA